MPNIYDTIIIGTGPAGVAAGVYAARKKIKTLILTDELGGQSKVAREIENWIGEIKISGSKLSQKLTDHLKNYEYKNDFKIKTQAKVVRVEKNKQNFAVKTEQKEIFNTKTIIVASGARHRKLNIPGEDKFMSKGVVYCSTCDAPLFKNKNVLVVGAGNSGIGAVIDLLPYAKKINLMDVLSKVKADQILFDKIKKSNKVKLLLDSEIIEIFGNNFVKGIKYKNKNNQLKKIMVSGVFVEIGTIPNSEFIKNLIKTDELGQIKINHKTKETSCPGVYAAGDVTDQRFKQSNIAAGDGVVALLSAYEYLNNF